MGTWGELLKEISQTKVEPKEGNTSPFDKVRRKYLALAHAHTGRATILYATKWLQPNPHVSPLDLSINNEDLHGFMEAVHGLEGDGLDLILHSPGGQPGAAEAVVKYLRTKFDNIRVIVPHMAMSAATMIACAADEIVMGKHSFLGPIDPQVSLTTSLGARMVPGQAIIEQFELAKQECQDPAKMRAWLPMLSQYGPDLLVTCQNATKLSEELVSEWLGSYMFKAEEHGTEHAKEVASWLSAHSQFKSHGRPISRDELIAKGLTVTSLEDDQVAQDLFLSIFHAVSIAFNGTGAVKIIENHLGKAYLKQQQQVMIQHVGDPQPPGGQKIVIPQQLLQPAIKPPQPQPPPAPPRPSAMPWKERIKTAFRLLVRGR